MAKFKVDVSGGFTHSYEIEAESQDEAEREALSMLSDGRESIWFELGDFDIVDTEVIEDENE